VAPFLPLCFSQQHHHRLLFATQPKKEERMRVLWSEKREREREREKEKERGRGRERNRATSTNLSSLGPTKGHRRRRRRSTPRWCCRRHSHNSRHRVRERLYRCPGDEREVAAPADRPVVDGGPGVVLVALVLLLLFLLVVVVAAVGPICASKREAR
jgi:hypothetical protein